MTGKAYRMPIRTGSIVELGTVVERANLVLEPGGEQLLDVHPVVMNQSSFAVFPL